MGLLERQEDTRAKSAQPLPSSLTDVTTRKRISLMSKTPRRVVGVTECIGSECTVKGKCVDTPGSVDDLHDFNHRLLKMIVLMQKLNGKQCRQSAKGRPKLAARFSSFSRYDDILTAGITFCIPICFCYECILISQLFIKTISILFNYKSNQE